MYAIKVLTVPKMVDLTGRNSLFGAVITSGLTVFAGSNPYER